MLMYVVVSRFVLFVDIAIKIFLYEGGLSYVVFGLWHFLLCGVDRLVRHISHHDTCDLFCIQNHQKKRARRKRRRGEWIDLSIPRGKHDEDAIVFEINVKEQKRGKRE